MSGFHAAPTLCAAPRYILWVFPGVACACHPLFRVSPGRRNALAEAYLPPALAGAVSLGVAGCAVLALQQLAARLPAAPPTSRSLHDRPMPRVGGLAIWAG